MNDHERLQRVRAMAAGAGITQEHLKFVLDYLDRRTTELIECNNRMLDHLRVMHKRAEDAEKNIEFLLAHNGISQLNDVENARQAALAELGKALRELEKVRSERDTADAEVMRLVTFIGEKMDEPAAA